MSDRALQVADQECFGGLCGTSVYGEYIPWWGVILIIVYLWCTVMYFGYRIIHLLFTFIFGCCGPRKKPPPKVLFNPQLAPQPRDRSQLRDVELQTDDWREKDEEEKLLQVSRAPQSNATWIPLDPTNMAIRTKVRHGTYGDGILQGWKGTAGARHGNSTDISSTDYVKIQFDRDAQERIVSRSNCLIRMEDDTWMHLQKEKNLKIADSLQFYLHVIQSSFEHLHHDVFLNYEVTQDKIRNLIERTTDQSSVLNLSNTNVNDLIQLRSQLTREAITTLQTLLQKKDIWSPTHAPLLPTSHSPSSPPLTAVSPSSPPTASIPPSAPPPTSSISPSAPPPTASCEPLKIDRIELALDTFDHSIRRCTMTKKHHPMIASVH